jgi:hypothetical protein
MHVDVAHAGEHNNMCIWRSYVQLWQQIKPIKPAEIEVEQDDVWTLKDSHRERILRAGAFAHHRDAGLTVEEHP